MFRNYAQSTRFLSRIMDFMRSAERYNRPVVHGMMEGRPRQNQAIYKSHGYAAEDTGFEFPERATRGRTMQVKFFSIPAIQGRNNIRLAIDAESDVSKKARIQNCVNRVRVVRASAWQTTKFSALCPFHPPSACLSRSNSLPKSCLHRPRMPVQNGTNSE